MDGRDGREIERRKEGRERERERESTIKSLFSSVHLQRDTNYSVKQVFSLGRNPTVWDTARKIERKEMRQTEKERQTYRDGQTDIETDRQTHALLGGDGVYFSAGGV